MLGFSVCRFTPASLPAAAGERLDRAIADGHHGTMEWLATSRDRRRTPRAMWAEAETAIMLGINYGPAGDPLASLRRRDRATISVYARNRDYHDLIKGRLKTLAQKIVKLAGGQVRVFVDTAPLMEKPLAQQAGIGWQGKHTNLVSRDYGSWLFLGAILTSAQFPQDAPMADFCGNCRACLDICPTDAFPAPYRLDARKCISYLTIEHKGPIPAELRAPMGNRIFGCDDCLAVCPWNKFARKGKEARLQARTDLEAPRLAELADLDEQAFRARFAGSPIKRTGRNRFLRNVLIAIGNSRQVRLAHAALPHLEEPDPVVRGAAVWAISRLLAPADIRAEAARRLPFEKDAQIRTEWRDAVRQQVRA